MGRSRSRDHQPRHTPNACHSQCAGQTHHPAVYFRGASDRGKDFNGDVEVPEKSRRDGSSGCSCGLSGFEAGEEVRSLGKPAELRIPLHGVDVEEHGAAGVGDVRAVDPSVAAPCQALRGNSN